MDVFDIIVRYNEAFCKGIKVTLELAAIAWAVGLTIGWILGASAHQWPVVIGYPLRTIAFILSGVPFLVLLFWANYPLQSFLNVTIDPFVTSATLLSIINTVIVAEIWRNALDSFRREYLQAAKVCGLGLIESLRYIQFPLVFRQVLPMLLAVQVTMLQMTLFASLISVEELFRVAQQINSSTYQTVDTYSALAIFFILICVPPYVIAYWLRIKFTRDLSEN